MPEIVFAAEFITADNRNHIAHAYRTKDFARSPQTLASIEPGNVIVTRRVTLKDPFDALCYRTVSETYWCCTRDEFDRTFDITDDDADDFFAMITPKQ